MLQAESEKLRQAWIQAVQASIASAYRESPDICSIEVSPDVIKYLPLYSDSSRHNFSSAVVKLFYLNQFFFLCCFVLKKYLIFKSIFLDFISLIGAEFVI